MVTVPLFSLQLAARVEAHANCNPGEAQRFAAVFKRRRKGT
jgi:hypothetical protein